MLLAQPLALAAFLFAVAIVLIGGSLLMFLVKGGTVTVLVAAERAAGAIEHPPLRLPAFRRAAQFSLERFAEGAQRLFRRYVVLGSALTIVYGVCDDRVAVVIFGPAPQEAVGGSPLRCRSSLVAGITIVNLLYLLLQIVDRGGRLQRAPKRLDGSIGLLRAEFRTVRFIFVRDARARGADDGGLDSRHGGARAHRVRAVHRLRGAAAATDRVDRARHRLRVHRDHGARRVFAGVSWVARGSHPRATG